MLFIGRGITGAEAVVIESLAALASGNAMTLGGAARRTRGFGGTSATKAMTARLRR